MESKRLRGFFLVAHRYFLNDLVSRRNKLRRGGDEEEDRVEEKADGMYLKKLGALQNSFVSY